MSRPAVPLAGGGHRRLLVLLGLVLVAALAAFGLAGRHRPPPSSASSSLAALGAFGWLNHAAAGLHALGGRSRSLASFTRQVGRSPTAAAGLIAHPEGRPTADRGAPPARLPESHGPGTSIALIWAIAIARPRSRSYPLAPELSDDIHRYLWDGHVLTQGVNPYAHPPGDDALAALRTPWHGEINNPDVPTIYPPLSQILFGLVALAGGPAILAAKLLWICFDLGCGLLLHRIATRSGRDPAPVLVWYLWSPLLIVETAWSAHFDAVGLFLMAALILAAGRGAGGRDRYGVRDRDGPRHAAGARLRPWLPGALLAAATLLKFAPAATLPVLIRRHGAATLVAFAAVCAAFYLPFAGAGADALTEGLRTYARHWSANEGAFALIAALAEDPIHARAIATALVLGVVGYATWRRFSAERALLWIIGAGLLLSPTVHPWYTLWVLPMAALRGSRAFLLLGGLAFLGYWGLASYQATGVWPQPLWNRAAIWLPVWLMLLWGFVGRLQPERQIPRRKEGDEGQ